MGSDGRFFGEMFWSAFSPSKPLGNIIMGLVGYGYVSPILKLSSSGEKVPDEFVGLGVLDWPKMLMWKHVNIFTGLYFSSHIEDYADICI